MRRLWLTLAAAALLAAGCGGSRHAGTRHGGAPAQQKLLVGAVEDAAKWSPNPKATMALARDTGFRAVVLSAVWSRGDTAAHDLPPLRRAVAGAGVAGVEPIVAVYQMSSSTPLTDADRTAFASYAAALVRALPEVHDVIVGNEPNLNLFWMPQFDTSGGDAAAPAFERLLAQTYDAVKTARPDVTVIGAGLSPHGSDDPSSSRPTHSPTQFIRDLGAAYRASGRTKPIFDVFDIHVYGESPQVPPTVAHPNTTSIGIADYGKLVGLLRSAFGTVPPIAYGEYGVETAIPPDKASLYSGHEVVAAVDPATQARYYDEAIGMAACQPEVKMLFLFHVTDESKLSGLQSGLRYADGSPKPSLALVQPHLAHPVCKSPQR
jgi:hypothetical protein